jgi:hypothetical protein
MRHDQVRAKMRVRLGRPHKHHDSEEVFATGHEGTVVSTTLFGVRIPQVLMDGVDGGRIVSLRPNLLEEVK